MCIRDSFKKAVSEVARVVAKSGYLLLTEFVRKSRVRGLIEVLEGAGFESLGYEECGYRDVAEAFERSLPHALGALGEGEDEVRAWLRGLTKMSYPSELERLERGSHVFFTMVLRLEDL
eukprot:TRINITY_DN51608_c0_g1_i1.p1 TRINITY_DN51608_c0_g1~~TRINITY_DN51608_c0_g1_i1.p1  ORF type:complete len:119 (-),score=48.35 TRINITY_DN51608_c0_g1_i1:286-642(-)